VAGDPYFTNVNLKSRDEGPKIVRGASQRIIRAVPGSQGQEVREETIGYAEKAQFEDWLPDDIDQVDAGEPGSGTATGFGRWMRTEGSLQDQRRFSIENTLGPLNPNEERRILDAAPEREQRLMSQAEVSRDEVTRIPDNVSWQDPQAESDRFFGSEKRPRELDRALDRIKDVDQGKEQVDYRKSKAIPIKVLRRR
jgi:hypothetical protein